MPRDHQLRPRRTVYEQEVGRATRGKGNKDKYGWERTLQRQYLDRTLLEKYQTGTYLYNTPQKLDNSKSDRFESKDGTTCHLLTKRKREVYGTKK
ncbi:hypothetical protein IX318_001779 [Porphyromonas levii]|nr:hypothetical protein [Porphyromonas levii]